MLSVISRHQSPAKKFEDLGSPARVIFGAVAIFIISQIVAAILVELLISLIDNLHGGRIILDNSIPLQFLFVLIAEALAIKVVFKIIKRRKLGLNFIGLGRKPELNDAYQSILAFFGYYLLVIIVGVVVKILLPDFKTDQEQNLGFNNLYGPINVSLAFIALVFLPPLGEEILVRGYLYSGLRAGVKLLPAAITTSLIFALAHLELGGSGPLVWGAAIQTFVLSGVLIYLREKTGALYAGMGLHMLNNLVAFLVIYH